MASADDSLSVHIAEQAALAESSEKAREASEFAERHMPAFVERLRELVNVDSGEDSPEGRERVAERLAEWARRAGCTCELLATEGGSHLIARLPGSGGKRIVLLGHHDTVFERGTAAKRPFGCDGGRAVGPGVADMKGGLLVGLLAVEALARGERNFESVELHSAPDEEVRTTALPALPRLRGAAAALVFECGRENGDLVVGRKAGAWIRLSARGEPAHAGTEPEKGHSAVLLLCRELLRCDDLNGSRPGLSVIAGTFSGGTMANVVPERAEAVLDVRATSAAELEWAIDRIAAVAPESDGRIDVSVDVWPGIEPNPATAAMFAAARHLAGALGTAVGGQTTGGVSDGCWTAAAGLPTIDGLGPVGGRDHSADEYIELRSVPVRCGLTVGLCDAIARGVIHGEPAEGGGPKGAV